MPRDARVSLHDILDSTQYLLREAPVTTLEAFLRDKTAQLAVDRSLEIIGEAVTQLRRDHPGVYERFSAASQITGLRNILVHAYWSVDHREVWSILKTDIEPLRALVENLLNDPSLSGSP